MQGAFNWLVDNYPRLADWTASARRVASLMVSLDSLENAEHRVGRIERGGTGGAALRLGHLSVTLEDGTVVVKDAQVVIARGERVLVAASPAPARARSSAPSRVYGHAVKDASKSKPARKCCSCPSRLTFRSARCDAPSPILGRRKKKHLMKSGALKLGGLDHLVDHIEEEAPWDQMLSGGEKQRLAFARILLHRPNIVVLDEATSALDPTSQDHLMELLTKELSATTIVSVTHRPELEMFHDRKIMLERQRGGATFATDTRLAHEGSA